MLPVQFSDGRPQGRFKALLLGVVLCFSAAAFAQTAIVQSAKPGAPPAKRVAKASDDDREEAREREAKAKKNKAATPKTVKYGHEPPKPAPPGVRTLVLDGKNLGVPSMNSVSYLTRLIEALKEQNEEKQEKKQREREEKMHGMAREMEGQKGERIAVRPDAAAQALRKQKGLKEPKIEEDEDERLDILEAALHYLKPRAFPNDGINPSAFRSALVQRDKMPAAQLKTVGDRAAGLSRTAAIGPAVSGPTWEFLGPKSAQPPWQFGAGPPNVYLNGRVNAVAFDPTTRGTVYLVSPSGGVWKSTNSGDNWTALGDKFSSLKLSSVAVGGDGAVYVGMGDYAYPANYGFSVYSRGIMRSRDGGATWQNIGANLMSGMAVSAIAVDPENPRIVIATAGRGDNPKSFVFVSNDGGDTFQRRGIRGVDGQGDWNDVKYGIPDAGAGGRRFVYAVCSTPAGATRAMVWRSADQGRTWKNLVTPLMTPYYLPYYQAAVAPSASDPNVVYLLDGDTLLGFGQVWKGVRNPADDSYEWTDITGNYDERFQNFGQAFYDMHARAAVQGGKEVLYFGTLGFGGSYGADDIWTDISRTYDEEIEFVLPPTFEFPYGYKVTAYNDQFHTDQHCMAIDPFNPNIAIVGSDGGAYRLEFDPAKYNPNTPAENYKAWEVTSLNANLGITEFYFGDFHPTDTKQMLGGAQDNSTPNATTDLDRWTNVGVGDGGGAAIVKTRAGFAQFSSNQFYSFIFRTGDNWQTRFNNRYPWDELIGGDPGEDIAPFFTPYDYVPFVGPLISDDNSSSVYLLTDWLWRWDEPQQRWFGHLGGINFSPLGLVNAMGIAPTDGKRLYLGTTEGLIWMSKNQGATWYKIVATGTQNPFRTITGIDVNPTNPADIVVTYSGTGTAHVWRCANVDARPIKFVSISGFSANGLPDIPANTAARDLNDPDNGIFVGTDIGVFYTSDGGKNWGNATTPLGLPNVRVNVLKAVPGTGYLNAVTYGRGMWRLQLTPAATVPHDDPVKISASISKATVQNGQVTALLTVSNNSDVIAAATQIKDIEAVFGTNVIKGAPIPLNIGTIPGQRNGKTYSVSRYFTFPATVAGPGDTVTVTFKGTYVQTGPHPFALTATVVMP